ncbi:helix-turn-helix domain-containing protein [Duganella dendranthematis]|uniref:Helix-turn-helix domain-containing protein n=1 Tax=Duganella dendranthematis TaxID=2728021 RepID=A0ABX6MB80_9BURK|nr:helix-turn-helix domain-containing protein [Duganella dendranthematis]QJD91366.1 helix-turn-helix domain-containing protein [Duganella dendranthematis]
MTPVPRLRLYVEHHQDENWFVHVGHVANSGRWQIEPHTHPEYGQLIFVREGRGVITLEGQRLPFAGPCALLLPTDCVHGLDYEVDLDRWVVTIEVSYLAQINARLPELTQLWSGPRLVSLSYAPEVERESYQLIRRLEQEMLASAIGRAAALEALLTLLLLTLIRAMPNGQFEPCSANPANVRQAERFRELVNQHHGKNLRLHDYAALMALSVAQLRAACAAALGQSPTKIIHSRIVTEAKRSLIFSDLPVEQIAFRLGFDDAAYFTRFFRREVGQTPSQFRTSAKN